jgi:hypothetical protein
MNEKTSNTYYWLWLRRRGLKPVDELEKTLLPEAMACGIKA